MPDPENTQPSNPIASLTREELELRYSMYRALYHLARGRCRETGNEYALSTQLHEDTDTHWRTALARAERAERALADMRDQRNDFRTERDEARAECAALTKERDGLRADLAVMTNDRNHLMKGNTSEIPNSSPALRPFDCVLEVKDCTVSMRVTAMPESVRGQHGMDNPICTAGGMTLRSSTGGPYMNAVAVWLWGNERSLDSKTDSVVFVEGPAAAESYAQKVRALFDVANAQWAEKHTNPEEKP